MKNKKVFPLLGVAIFGAALIGAILFSTSKAQTTGPKLLQVSDIDTVSGMSTSNPLANYPAGNPSYPGQEVSFDNEGISIFIMNSSYATAAIKTDASNAYECGHLGLQEWKGGNYAYKLTDANTWQKRQQSACNGIVVIGSSGQIRAQTLTIKGTSVDGRPFTLQVNVPDPALWDNEVGGGSRRLFVDDTGATYGCKSLSYSNPWPNECEFSPHDALQRTAVGPSGGAVCGNNLCQTGETYASCSADCPAPPPTCTLTATKTSYTKPEFVNYTYTCSAPTSVAVQVVKPDGIATTYNTSLNITTSTMGFDTTNLDAGNYTLRICVNDTACSPSSLVSVPFTVTAPTMASCTKLNIVLNRGTNSSNVYTKGDNVNYTFSCEIPTGAPVANGTIKLVKPDGTATTLITVSNVTSTSQSYGFPTNDFAEGTYMLKACLDPTCTSTASTGLASFIIAASGGTSGTTDSSLVGWWKFDGNGNNEVAGKPAAITVGRASFQASGGQLGGYAYIPTDSDFVKVPYNSVYDLPNSFTIEFWFRQRANQSFFQDLVYKGTPTNNYNFRIFRQLWNQYNFGPIITGYTAVNTGYWSQTSNSNQLAHNTWHHVVYTKDTSGSAYYLDGVQIHRLDTTQYSEYSGPAKTPASDIIIGDSAVDTDIDNLRIYNRALSASEAAQNGGFPVPTTTTTATTTTTPGASAPEPLNNETGVWAQVDIATGQILTTAICTRSVCGINGEYHGYVPPASFSTGSTWWPTSKRYIWQMSGQAGYGSGTFNFSTYVFTVAGGTIYNGVFTSTTTPTGSTTITTITTTTTATTTAPMTGTNITTTPSSCGNGERCSAGSWCNNGQKCYYPEGQITCVAWSPASTGTGMASTSIPACPGGTLTCAPTDSNCVEPGGYKNISSNTTMSYWCGGGGSMMFYSSSKVYCEKKTATTSTGTMWTGADIKATLNKLGSGWGMCRPGESNCIEPGRTGPSSGWCAWMPPSNYSPSTTGTTRTCPGLDTPSSTAGEPMPPITAPMPGEMRECGTNEMSTPSNMCMMPKYRWNIAAKAFEKCDSSQSNVYTNLSNNPGAKYTNCESMNYELEREWRTERYLMHPPETAGEWYMPMWDAASKSFQYNPGTNSLGECETRQTAAMTAGAPMGYVSPCQPIPEIDRSWMLKKFRAEYKMYQLWNGQGGSAAAAANGTTANGATAFTQTSQQMQPNPTVPVEITADRCKNYITGIRQNVGADKQFWKDVRAQLDQAPVSYPDITAVNNLLGDAKDLISAIEKSIRPGTCASDITASIQTNSDKLHKEIFPEISSYLPDIQSFAQYQQCARGLQTQNAQLKALLNKGLSASSRTSIESLIADIENKLKELESNVSDFEFDGAEQCREFSADIQTQTAPLLRSNDRELNRIINDVVMQKFGSFIGKLTDQLEERGKKIDELLVQMAELHKIVAAISETASKISDKITISYTALSRIEDKFAQQKTEIQNTKDKLIPAIEEATKVMQEERCLPDADKENMIQQLGMAASVNWLGEKADAIIMRIQLFTAACKAHDVKPSDVASFKATVDNSSAENLQASYGLGMTPFPDVPTHEWYYGGMMTGHQTGFITQGRPAESVLRQDALLMVLRASGMTDSDLAGNCSLRSRTVSDVSPYAVCAVNKGIDRGLDLKGSMKTPTSRIEIAKWIAQLFDLPRTSAVADVNDYTDVGGLSNQDKLFVAKVVVNEIMVGQVGVSTKAFEPYNPLTRAALAVILEKLLSVKGNLPG